MEESSSVHLLLRPDVKKNDFKLRKLQQNRSANALFFGVVFGFVFSFLFAYSGVLDETTNIDYSLFETLRMNNSRTEVAAETRNLAEYLKGKVRVLCVMMTSNNAMVLRGEIIMDTWGKRCNKIIFFSDKANTNFTNLVVLTQTNNLAKLREAMKYVHSHHYDEFDWILKTNDDAYVVLENLRHLLYQYETDWPLVIGQRLLPQDYMRGVYVISRRAFTRLVEDAFSDTKICAELGGDEDIDIASCFQHIGVIKVDGIDSSGRGMFFKSNPETALFPEKTDNYDEFFWHKLKQGIDNCCSDRLISIQGVVDSHLYYMEYFIYKVHAFGRHRNPEPLPPKISLDDIIKNNY